MSKTKSKPKTATQQKAGGDCVSRLVGMVESAIRATAGRMFLDIHIEDELTDAIRHTIEENLGWGNTERQAMESALGHVFSNHEERLKDAARDDANCSKAHALRSLPNDEWWHRRDQAPIQLGTLSPVATHGLFSLLFLL
jgi:hypothetical protein